MTRLIRRELQANPDPHHTVDIRDYLRRTMWDIFGLIVLGHDFQTLDKPAAGTREKLVGILGRMNGRLVQWANFIMTYVDVRPLLKVLSPLLMKSPTGKALEQIRNSVTQAVGRKETEFRADTARRGSNEQREGEGEGSGRDITHISLKSGVFPSEELIDNAMLFLTAGPNSTAAAVEWAIYEMCRRPEIQARLRDEINECLDPAQLNGTSGLSGAALLRNLQSLPYLSAVCNEVIRYYPFVPLSPRVAERDTSLLGVPIPRGTTLLTPVEVFNRSKELWGDDAEEFNPDRWMGVGRETNGGAANAYAFMSFGAGPGTCIGKDYARAMMACLVAALVREFEIEVVNLETAGRLLPAPFKKSLEGMQVRLRALHHS
jgi:cytochrome P450